MDRVIHLNHMQELAEQNGQSDPFESHVGAGGTERTE